MLVFFLFFLRSDNAGKEERSAFSGAEVEEEALP